jgi:large subunit ribosomal protein L25
VEIECVPVDIPDQFDVDVTELMIGSAIRVSELPVKEGVRIITAGDAVIAHVVGIKEEAAAEAVAAVAEPEVAAKKGKKEEEAAAADKGKAPAAKAPAADKGKKK